MALHTASTADSGLSLWLSPPSAATSSPLQDYIGELARRTVPSKDAEPIIFAPHTTLVSDKIVPALEVEDVLDKIKAGVQEWRNGGGGGGDGGAKGLKLRFKKVQQGDKFYQCVLVALHKDEALLSLHATLLKTFGASSDKAAEYFPHMSLIYGDSTTERKDEIIADMSDRKEFIENGDGVQVAELDGYEPNEILLVRTAGLPEKWEVMGRVPL